MILFGCLNKKFWEDCKMMLCRKKGLPLCWNSSSKKLNKLQNVSKDTNIDNFPNVLEKFSSQNAYTNIRFSSPFAVECTPPAALWRNCRSTGGCRIRKRTTGASARPATKRTRTSTTRWLTNRTGRANPRWATSSTGGAFRRRGETTAPGTGFSSALSGFAASWLCWWTCRGARKRDELVSVCGYI